LFQPFNKQALNLFSWIISAVFFKTLGLRGGVWSVPLFRGGEREWNEILWFASVTNGGNSRYKPQASAPAPKKCKKNA
jgi:hypothetical protein